ncbi:unnamed protein product, partial [Brassica oleracea]
FQLLVIISNPFSFKFQLVKLTLLQVMRGGITVKISIYNVVFGDVPADGVLISGHSLAIDESNMTCESKIVHKDKKSPFLMSGCKVADGVGNMMTCL